MGNLSATLFTAAADEEADVAGDLAVTVPPPLTLTPLVSLLSYIE